ncbi:MAG: metal ABC transporter permease [Bacteroidales bacterium]|nr:metal ABC transporter permease [Bacteroidales bacterium]
MSELFNYNFFNYALLAAIFTSITCGIIGTYIVTKRIVFISGGITHTSFGGIGIGYFLGFNPLIGAVVFSVLSAIGIEFLSKKTEVREDSAIAIFWSFGMAIGIIFIYLSPGYAPNLMSYLFGSILTVSRLELALIIGLSFIVITFFIFNYKTILFITFDPEFSKTKNIPVVLYNNILIVLVALTIVLSIKIAGIILIMSLLTIPQATANLIYKDFRKIIYTSIFIGILASIAGISISYFFNIPSGATIIFTLVFIFIATRVIKSILLKSNKQGLF